MVILYEKAHKANNIYNFMYSFGYEYGEYVCIQGYSCQIGK